MLNLAVRFGLELAGVATAGYLGFQFAPSGWRPLGAIAGAIALATVWGLFLAPKASSPIPLSSRELVGTILLLAVAGTLALSGQLWWGLGFAALLVANQAVLLLVGPRTGEFA
ncbi:uncharacterized protein DUF2568 [Propionicimonas paludicola]|uniref:Uncharacterized protein DUF2568 n=1 Tax=Propionicimonas paludicola TaxID=185243 RepID=A0A2A9CTV2_9ACTN|nr:YrdB family protein [Propionicimonas paludicola]PFG17536.1 uncharacterized protein DUF2568 [Propionicimonas paludicola]